MIGGKKLTGYLISEGALARILSEKKQVHHKVRSSLDSQDAVELEAAIYAAERYSFRNSFLQEQYF